MEDGSEQVSLLTGQLQAFFLVSDDIMDGSKTRRGQPCWYKVVRFVGRDGGDEMALTPSCDPFTQEGVGLVAINDAFILEAVIYKMLKSHFRKDACYVDLLELFHEVTYQTELGQMMDLITAPEDNVDLNRFTMAKCVSLRIQFGSCRS
jgi:farnesyl diphosphate synthase